MDFLEKLNSLMNDRGLNRNTLSAGSGIPYTTIDSFYKKGFESDMGFFVCFSQMLLWHNEYRKIVVPATYL